MNEGVVVDFYRAGNIPKENYFSGVTQNLAKEILAGTSSLYSYYKGKTLAERQRAAFPEFKRIEYLNSVTDVFKKNAAQFEANELKRKSRNGKDFFEGLRDANWTPFLTVAGTIAGSFLGPAGAAVGATLGSSLGSKDFVKLGAEFSPEAGRVAKDMQDAYQMSIEKKNITGFTISGLESERDFLGLAKDLPVINNSGFTKGERRSLSGNPGGYGFLNQKGDDYVKKSIEWEF